MATPNLKQIYEPFYEDLTKAIENKSNINLLEFEQAFKEHPELLFYSPSHEDMSKVSASRIEIDSIAYMVLNHTSFLSSKVASVPASFLLFIEKIMPLAMSDKNVFGNFLLAFLGKENPLPTSNRLNSINLDGYRQIVKSIMLSSHFSQTHMEDIFLSTLKKQKDFSSSTSLHSMMRGHDYVAETIFMTTLGVNFNENDKIKSLLNDLMLNPIDNKLKKNNAAASLLVFLTNQFSSEKVKAVALKLIKEISPHINHLDAKGNSFLYYAKGIRNDKEREYVVSVLNDFGAIYISPSITNKFMGMVIDFCKILVPSKKPPEHPLQPSPVQENLYRDLGKEIKQLDFSKFTSSQEMQKKLKLRLQDVYSKSQDLLGVAAKSNTLELNDVFFIKKDILEVFLISSIDLTKSLSSFSSIYPVDTKAIFEPWLEQLNIIESKLDNIHQTLKNNLISHQTTQAQVNLKVLKAKS